MSTGFDGLLNIVPFGALMNEDEEYLIQTHDLHLLTSGRDLLLNEYQLAVGEYLVMAGPDYDAADVVADDVIKAAEGRRPQLCKWAFVAPVAVCEV